MLLIPDNVSIKEELYKIIHLIVNFYDDKEMEKEYKILNQDKDYVAKNMSMNEGIKKQSNNNDFTISGNHTITNKLNNYYIKKC